MHVFAAVGKDSGTSGTVDSFSYLSRFAAHVGQDPKANHEAAEAVLSWARLPQPLVEQFRARPLVLFRPLATPNREMRRFLALARLLGRTPLVLTMPWDRFTPSRNATKRHLAKLPIAYRTGAIEYVRVVAFEEAQGLPLREVHCLNGSPLTSFHDRLLDDLCGSRRPMVMSAEAWWDGGDARTFYPRFLAAFTCLGVLAENWSLLGWERSFTKDVVLPSIADVIARFGVSPRVAALLPEGDELALRWECYPRRALALARSAATHAGYGRPQ